ncbi:MAG: hypothetical protein J6U60_01090 [Clostridia bacterium]|nr:hypothetical protein [Clostridia bacterium]
MKKRTESFFGLHFDFHATKTTREIGKTFKYEWISELLETVKPDYVQCDAKGHPGITSYPSAYGTSAPDMCIDIMQAWREITKKYGVALFAHYSGVYDVEAIENHPKWAVIDKNGVLDKDHTSVFSPYKDEKMLPQLKELAGKYGLDGAWVDGDCWGCRLDFSAWAQEAFEEKYGRKLCYEQDKKLYLDFCREGYWAYVRHFIEEMRKEYPQFQVTSNWATSTYSPYVGADLPLEFLSGDLTWVEAIDNGARFETRFLAQNKLPWDIMSWAFVHWSVKTCGAKIYKPAVELMQEAAHTLELGGGVQLYFMQSPKSGLANRDVIHVSKAVSDFCREREAYCHKKELVKETVLLFSTKDYYDEIDEVMFTARKAYMEDYRLSNNVLLENGYCTLFSIAEKGEALDGFKTVVVTNAGLFTPDEITRVLEFAETGGNVVITGDKSCLVFANALSIEAKEKEACRFVLESQERFLECKSELCLLDSKAFDCVEKAFYTYEAYYDNDDEGFVSIGRKRVGKGQITFVPFAIGNTYADRKPVVLRDFVRKAVGISPTVEIANSHLVDVVMSKEADKTFVHLINNGGRHSSPTPAVFDEIVPLHDLQISIASEKAPKKITLRPSGEDVPFTWVDGKIKLALKKLPIYEILEIK